MTQDHNRPTAPPPVEPAPSPDRTRGIQMMVLGGVIAVLGPLGGFLAGSMVGPEQELGEYDAMILWMFAGLCIGSIGAVLVFLGLLRWTRASRNDPMV